MSVLTQFALTLFPRRAASAWVACASIVAAAVTSPVQATESKQTATQMLFDNKHLDNLSADAKVVYRFTRDVSRPDLFGEAFSDDVSVAVRKVAADGTREVDVRVFTGERARDPYVIDGLTGNPILIVFLDRSVSFYKALAGGSLPYLKDRFRTGLRDRATLEPVKIKVGDRIVDGTRVTITPYAGDPSAAKMQGYENSRFSIVVSDAVPGHYVELVANYVNSNKDAPGLKERYVAAGMEVLQ